MLFFISIEQLSIWYGAENGKKICVIPLYSTSDIRRIQYLCTLMDLHTCFCTSLCKNNPCLTSLSFCFSLTKRLLYIL